MSKFEQYCVILLLLLEICHFNSILIKNSIQTRHLFFYCTIDYDKLYKQHVDYSIQNTVRMASSESFHNCRPYPKIDSTISKT